MEPAIAASSLIFSRLSQQMSCQENDKHVAIRGFSEMRETLKSGERREKKRGEKRRKEFCILFIVYLLIYFKKIYTTCEITFRHMDGR